jgi:D-Tyr-tRNAtyr deacylase
MRVVVQRVTAASVSVGDRITGRIGSGLLVLAGFEDADGDADLEWMAGEFGADMQVTLVNDGPVTLAIDSRAPE